MEYWKGYSCHLEDVVGQEVSYMRPDPPHTLQYLEKYTQQDQQHALETQFKTINLSKSYAEQRNKLKNCKTLSVQGLTWTIEVFVFMREWFWIGSEIICA